MDNNFDSSCLAFLSSRRKLSKRPIGRILVDGGFISGADLEIALAEQRHTNELLGEILVRMGLINPVELSAALSVQRELASLDSAVKAGLLTRQLLGELLMRTKHITPEQLEFALREQELSGEKLGEVFLRLGILSEPELHAVLGAQREQEAFQPPVSFRLGEILVSANLISRRQLEGALDKQRLTGQRIGEVLVDSGYVGHEHVTAALSIQRKLLTAALMAVLSLSAIAETQAYQDNMRTAKASLTVSATVRGFAKLKVLRQSAEIVVTPRDIRRGYVDVPAGTAIDVQSNTHYYLVFEGLDAPFKAVHINGLRSGEVVISSGVGLIEQPYTNPGKFLFEISYRFMLSEDAHPGTYAWPLNISVSPA